MASRDDILNRMKDKLAEAGISGATKKDCGVALDAALGSIKEVAMEEGSIRTVIGTFRRKDQAARIARNPRTGEQVDVPAKTTLGFKPSSSATEVEADEAPAPKAKVAAKAPAKVAAKAPVKAPVKKLVAKK